MFSKTARETARRLAVLALVVGLVAQAAASPAMASSTSSSPDCEPTGPDRGYGDLVADMFTGGESVNIGLKLIGQGEDVDCYSGEQVKNLTSESVYISAVAAADQSNLTTILTENHIKDMRPYVRSQVKAEIVREWQNESSAAEIKAAVNETIEDEYARVERNMIESHNSIAFHVYALANQSYQVGAEQWYATSQDDSQLDNTNVLTNPDGAADRYVRLDERNHTLTNGTNITVHRIWGAADTDDSLTNGWDPFLTGSSHHRLMNGTETKPDRLQVVNASEDQRTIVLHPSEWRDSWDLLRSEEQRMKDNAAVLVDNLTAQYGYYELNITEILSASDLVTTWSTNLNTTGYYSWAAAELSTLGINGSTAQSFAIEYEPEYDGQAGTFEPNQSTYNGSTLNMSGTLFTDWRPAKTNGIWKHGVTYEIPEDKVVIFVWQETSNSTRRVRLDGNVTVRQLTDVQTGETLNETVIQNEYRATFTTEFNESWLENLLEYQKTIHEEAEAGGGGGGGFDFGGFDFGAATIGFVGILALGGIAALGTLFN